jgi:lysophospholipase L1-like esterase
MTRTFLISAFLFISTGVFAQRIPIDEYSTAPYLSQLGSAFNRIFHDHHLDSVYIKLAAIKKNQRGTLRIVHIGDSHLQAGHFPGEVRTKLQDFFGNAGRGIVFPYDIIKTTSPVDITSSSNTGWKLDKVATTGDADNVGVSGFGMRTGSAGATIDLALKQGSFDRLRFFTGEKNAWIFRAGGDESSRMLKPSGTHFADISLETPASSFSVSAMPGSDSYDFYGVSLENKSAGVIYHSIGVNGARYEQYNKAELFWKQLPGLQADLYIISLGTNEAQKAKFDDKEFRKELNEFLKKLKKVSPHAGVILTTAQDSYKNGRSNIVLRDLNMFLFEYSTQNSIPVWDLYRVTNGYGSAFGWIRRGLMNRDMVHFTAEGYRLQGQLLFTALAKGYNNYYGY